MGLLRWNWLKKDINTKRRQSAPPLSSFNYDPDSNRDVYLKAFDQFNERRTSGLKSQIKQNNIIDNENVLPFNEFTDEEKQRFLIDNNAKENHNKTLNNENNCNASPNDQMTTSRSRHSLPASMSRSYISKSCRKGSKKNPVNNSVIFEDEVEEFEQKHCNNLDAISFSKNSPPVKFFKDNSNPYPEEKRPPRVLDVEYAEPTKSCLKISERVQRSAPTRNISIVAHSKCNKNEKNDSFLNGSYRKFDLNTSSCSDENVISSKSYGFRKNKNINNTMAPTIGQQQYERSINKHGDLVEYAVPYNEQEAYEPPRKPIKNILHNKSTNESIYNNSFNCENIINENFRFLNDTGVGDNLRLAGDSIVNELDWRRRNNVIVTDLDKSIDSGQTLDNQTNTRARRNTTTNDTEMSDLDTLVKWSQNLLIQNEQETNSSMNITNQLKHSTILCKPKEIKQKIGVLRSTYSTPLDFSSGIFRETNVTLRKCKPEVPESIRLVEEAIERDYEILSKIKHANIMCLMAACFNKKLISHMTLILEPVDYTLNFYLHQMKEQLSLFECISVVQQVASAALYLQACGYIHSNISSHCVLLRKHPWCVKLSSFELTTEIDVEAIRSEIEIKYGIINEDIFLNKYHDDRQPPKYTFVYPKNAKVLKEKYLNMSKQSATLKCTSNSVHSYIKMPKKYLPYNLNYRQHLSLHNYQAPELLAYEREFVLPTKRSDVFAVTTLLWELLNNSVPFVIYQKADLERLHVEKSSTLPIFEPKRCVNFLEIFKFGLELDPINRTIDLQYLITLLEEKKFYINESSAESALSSHCHIYENRENIGGGGDDVMAQSDRKIEKPVLPVPMSPTTVKNLKKTTNNSTASLNITNSTLYQSLLDFNKCLLLKDNEKCGLYERTSTLKKRKKSTLKQDKSKFITELFAEPAEKGQKLKTVEQNSVVSKLNENLDAISDNIQFNKNNVIDEFQEKANRKRFNKIDESPQIIGPLIVKENELPSKLVVGSQPAYKSEQLKRIEQEEELSSATAYVDEHKPTGTLQPLRDLDRKKINSKNKILDNSKSYDNLLLDDTTTTPNTSRSSMQRRRNKSLINSAPNCTTNSGYKFKITEYALPNTPIARKNKILRNAWLSDSTLSVNLDNAIDNSNLQINESSDLNKKLNISIKIVHNKVTPNATIPAKINEYDQLESPSMLSKINLWSSGNTLEESATDDKNMPNSQNTTKDKPLYFGRTSITPTKLDSLISESKRKSDVQQITELTTEISKYLLDDKDDNPENAESISQDKTNGKFENKLWKREKEICTKFSNSSQLGTSNENKSMVIVPEWTSVKETIKQFENLDSPKKSNVSMPQNQNSFHKHVLKTINSDFKEAAKTNNTYQEQQHTLIKRTIYSESIVASGVDFNSAFNDGQPSTFGASSGHKLTTYVTLNMRKSRRRSSDVGLMSSVATARTTTATALPLPEYRHSICGNQKNLINLNSESMSKALVPATAAAAFGGSSTKYVCCNCAEKLSNDEIRALTYKENQATSINSLALSCCESSSMVSNTKNRNKNAKSIEDLYIDDDYNQGMGANMELVDDTSGLIDFDIVSTDFFNLKD